MKFRETCTCGSEIDLDDDDAQTVAAAVRDWRQGHRCLGPQPWRRSARSTNDVRLDFGFTLDENEVMLDAR